MTGMYNKSSDNHLNIILEQFKVVEHKWYGIIEEIEEQCLHYTNRIL